MNTQRPSPYLDSHAHIQAPQFDRDRDAVLERARAAGVATIICSSDDEASSQLAVELARREQGIWATVGIHPHEAAAADAGSFARLSELAVDEHVVAVGEIGLDYFRDLSPRPVQREIFKAGLTLADQLQLPVVVHSRDAVEDTFAALREWCSEHGGVTRSPPGVIHCYSYDVAWAERFLSLGFHISIPGTITYPKADALREVALIVPEEALLVETDCPYLPPQRWRGKRNEPAYLVETVAGIASVRGIEPLYLAGVTAANATRLFRLNERARGTGEVRGAP